MVKLSDLLENDAYMPPGFGLVIFGELAGQCLEETEEENAFLEGLCPERILLNDDWYNELTEAKIAPAKKAPQSYAYYPTEYLQGRPWDKACSSFALFAISYRVLTGELPYIGSVPEELLSSSDGKKFIIRKRKASMGVKLNHVPASYRGFYAKGLSLKKKERYQAIGDTSEEFSALAEVLKRSEFEDSTGANELEAPTPPDFLNMLAQRSSTEFTLNVQTPDEGNLDDLVGLSDLKDYLRNYVLAIMKNPEKAQKYKLTIPNGLLLYGPTGCGKTTVAEKFAAEAQMKYSIIHSADVGSTLVHGTPLLVQQLFDQAAMFAPIILIFDEIDSLVPQRNHPDNTKVAEDTSAFLTAMNECGKKGIFVIGTTNRPQFMDSAILRSGRLGKKVYVPLPDEQTRTEMFHMYLEDRPIASGIDYQALGKLTSAGYISSDIVQICNDAAQKAFERDVIITQDIIEGVIRNGGPTVSKNELRSYEEARRYVDPAAKYSPYINQIGFR